MGACIQSVSKSRVLSLGVVNSQPNIWKFWTDLTSILSDHAERKRVREFLNKTKQNRTPGERAEATLLRMGVILVPRGMVDVGKFSTKTHEFWCRPETDSNLPTKREGEVPKLLKVNFSSAFGHFNYCTSFSSGHNVTISLSCWN